MSIDKFKDFISKYKKSDYISKKSIKSINDMGIEYTNFKNINDDVYNCYKFFNKNDTDIFDDILQESKDDNPVISINYSLMLSVKCDMLSSFDVQITDKDNIKDVKDAVEDVISSLYKCREIELSKHKLNIETSSIKRPGVKDSWSTYRYNSLLNSNSFKKVEIEPSIILRVEFNINEPMDDNDYAYNSDLHRSISNVKNKFKDDISSVDITGRYLSHIGYSNYKYTISDWGYAGFGILSKIADYKIEIKLK